MPCPTERDCRRSAYAYTIWLPTIYSSPLLPLDYLRIHTYIDIIDKHMAKPKLYYCDCPKCKKKNHGREGKVSKSTYRRHKPYRNPLSRFSTSFFNGQTHASLSYTAQSPRVHVADETSEGSAESDTEPMSPRPSKRMRHSVDNTDCQDADVGAFGTIFKTRLIALT